MLLLVCINLYAVVCYLAHAHRSTYPEMALAAVAVLASVFLRALGQRPEAGHSAFENAVDLSATENEEDHVVAENAINCAAAEITEDLATDENVIDRAAAESEASPAAEGSPISSCPAAGCPSAASCPLAERTGQESPAQVCPARKTADYRTDYQADYLTDQQTLTGILTGTPIG